jgi:thiol:disulfide interchange protein DsbD
MENAVWTDTRVKAKLEKDFVLISLMVDDKTALENMVSIEENGQTRKLRSIGDKWSYLQRYKFGANAQPFYLILTPEGRPLTHAYAFNDDPKDFLDYLNSVE